MRVGCIKIHVHGAFVRFNPDMILCFLLSPT